MDCSLPGPSVHGILQARILEWVAMPSTSVSPRPRDQTHVSYIYLHWQVDSFHQCHLGSPFILIHSFKKDLLMAWYVLSTLLRSGCSVIHLLIHSLKIENMFFESLLVR